MIADAMFEELGFDKRFDNDSFTKYVKVFHPNDTETVIISWKYGNYEYISDDGIRLVPMDLHMAIHQKLKEGGLIL